MPEDYLPEERLLDVIESSEENSGKESGQSEKKPIFFLFSFFKTLRFKEIKSEAKEIFNPEFQQKNIRIFIKGLKVIFVGMFFAVSFDIFITRYDISKILKRQPAVKTSSLEPQNIVYLKPPEYYIGRAKERDIFSKYIDTAPEIKELPKGEEVEHSKASENIKEKAKNFKLVGISWGESIEVMIENISDMGAYFLKEGQHIGKSGIYIKKIYDDRVILGYQDEEMEFF